MSLERGPRSSEHISPPEISVDFYSVSSEFHSATNEDNYFILSGNKAFGIFDGMGGHAGGEKASSLAAEVTRQGFEDLTKEPTLDANWVKEEIGYLLNDAHRAIVEENNENDSNMGTTACVGYILEGYDNRKLVVGNVGDSRVYVVDKEGEIIFVTLDDTPSLDLGESNNELDKQVKYDQQNRLSEAKDYSSLSIEDQFLFRNRHYISQSLGSSEMTPSLYEVDLLPGDRIMFVTDGVSDNLTESEMIKILQSQSEGVTGSKSASAALVEAALQRSKDPHHSRAKSDDMTAIVVTIGSEKRNQMKAKEQPSISSANTVEELFGAIDAHGPFQGSTQEFETGYIKRVIEEVLAGNMSIEYVTRADGLREAVQRIIKNATKTR